MRYQLIVVIVSVALLSACASTQQFDGFDNAHRACYAYMYGENGVGIDYEKALRFCREGSIDGSLSSMTLLAEQYYLGLGTPTDTETARHIYELAAAGGHIHAQLMVFLIYNRDFADTSTCEQKLRGLEYLQEAAESGHEKAIELLEIINEAIREKEVSEACEA